jgi:hypothetical protein
MERTTTSILKFISLTLTVEPVGSFPLKWLSLFLLEKYINNGTVFP